MRSRDSTRIGGGVGEGEEGVGAWEGRGEKGRSRIGRGRIRSKEEWSVQS